MGDYAYSAHRDGKYVSVPPIDDLCLALKDKFLRQEEQIERLKAENSRLKSENYKDEELAKMKNEYEAIKADNYRGFPISEKESKAIKEWLNNHECPYRRLKIGSSISYHFQSTSIGTFGTVKCSCGKEFTFQEP